MTTIRWGMIGCGDVAEVKSGPGFYKTRDSSLLTIMRRNGALAVSEGARDLFSWNLSGILDRLSPNESKLTS